jgi:prepilin-type N-terminal cleavage/methylation domain-containing protein
MIKKNGFTIIEVIVVMGIITILFSIASGNLFKTSYQTSLSNSVVNCIADIRQQQLQAMTGATSGSTPDNYGVYLDQNKYTLFKGVYDPNNAENKITQLEYPIQISSVQFPSSTILFASGSGSIIGFEGTQNSFSLSNTVDNQSKIIRFNKFGVPIGAQ